MKVPTGFGFLGAGIAFLLLGALGPHGEIMPGHPYFAAWAMWGILCSGYLIFKGFAAAAIFLDDIDHKQEPRR